MYIHLKVVAGTKKKIFKKLKKNHFEIWVKEKAERNMANRRVIELISSNFDIPISNVRIISGHRSPSKILSIKKDL